MIFFGDFYCLNYFYSIVSKTKLHSHKRVCENKDFCNIIMTSEDVNPANIRLDEDVLKTSSRCLSSFFKTPGSRRICSPQTYVFRRRLGQDQYIRLDYTSSRRLQDVFKTSCRNVFETSSRPLQDVLNTSSKRLQDVLKNIFRTSSRHLQDVSSS